jgi:D-alanyl-D-alanine carboxypeptidase
MALRGLDSRILRLAKIAAGACVALSVIAPCASPAAAHGWRHQHRHVHYAARYHRYYARRAAPAYAPPFSALVVDANSNRTLYSVNENELRHPASITKVMTLYLLFEQLDKGALTMQSQIPISAHAAAQEPSKLGLEPGETISVENAIKAIVTRSANDVAVAVAEAIGGSESGFAQMMTRKAHEIGMTRTQYVNATGLPNDGQITTAHDLAILGRSTEERFPRYFKFFSTHHFEYAGQIISSHNHLLGRVDGVDGIKTGFIRASGFNLLTSVHRDGRSLIAVVIGGRSAASRDATMEALISDHIAQASVGGHATMIAAAEPEAPRAPLPPVAAEPVRSAPPVFAERAPAPPARSAASRNEEAEGDADDEDDDAPRVAALLPPAKIAQRLAELPRADRPGANLPHSDLPHSDLPHADLPHSGLPYADVPRADWPHAAAIPPARSAPAPIVRTAAATPAALGWVRGPDAVKAAEKPEPAAKLIPVAAVVAPRAKEETQIARNDERANVHEGWIIQIGATDDAGKANDLLNRAREKERSALAAAKPLTEKVKRGADIFYRARFAGLDSASAELACRSLKRSGFSCFAMRD